MEMSYSRSYLTPSSSVKMVANRDFTIGIITQFMNEKIRFLVRQIRVQDSHAGATAKKVWKLALS